MPGRGARSSRPLTFDLGLCCRSPSRAISGSGPFRPLCCAGKRSMNGPRDWRNARPDRRTFLRRVAGAASFAAAAWSARAAFAEDAALDALIGDTQRGEVRPGLRRGFPHHPYAEARRSRLSPRRRRKQPRRRLSATRDIVDPRRLAASADRRRAASWRSTSERAVLRARLVASGDIDPNAAGNDIYDSYVEAAVRRFQARHGLTVDGVIHAETLAALNVPAPVRLAQLKVNVTRLRGAQRQSQPALCGRQHSGRPHRGDRERLRGVAPHRRCRQAGSAVARDQQQDHPDQLQSVLDGPAFDRAEGSDPENAGSAGLSHQQSHPHFRRRATRSCSRRRSIGTRKTRRITRSSRIPAASIRSARSASIFRANTASTCTTRR